MTTAVGLTLEGLARGIASGPVDGRAVTGITADSRAVKPGFVFAAMKGDKVDGAAFAGAAAQAGAAAILAAEDAVVEVPAGVPVLRAADPRLALALMAARVFPRQPEVLVAVTGTSGKTSVAYFTRQIFAAAGFKAAAIGTLGVVTDDGVEKGSLTTPDPVELHRTLDRLAREGFTHVALEASSHGLDQRRLDGLRLTAAGFTNLGRDHLDYHPSVEAYFLAKLRLLTEVLPAGKMAVIDLSGDVRLNSRAQIATADAGRDFWQVGKLSNLIRAVEPRPMGLAQEMLVQADVQDDGNWFDLRERWLLKLPLAGAFQVDNAIMALALAIAAGIPASVAVPTLSTLRGAPGRLEKVADTKGGGGIFIDYAHKPEAVTAVLATLRALTNERLIVVIGAGGDRDKGKRPLMGAAAVKGADVVIVTDDNPRSEDPATIRAAIMAAAPGAIEIAGRGEAIAAAVAMMKAGDVLCVAGKGHETGQIVGGRILPFSDHEAVAAALKEISP